MAPTRPEPVQEGDVGIHAYASQCDGIGGELKRVPADFVVTELLQDGQEVSLEPEGAVEEEAAAEEEADEEAEDEWDEDVLVRFVLRKEKQDTLGAVADLAEALGVPERAFSYAGLKDYHAVTVQEVVVQGVPPSRLRALQLARLQLGRIRLVERKLRLGECGGNRFRIRLRRLTRGREAVDAAIGALRERGFLNYFGLQRFGSHASRNDEVGRALLLGEYVQAVDSLLTNTRDGLKLPPAEREAREAWRRGDATAALRHMPRARVMERTLLKRLSLDMAKPARPTHEECCRRAMLAVPLAQRLLLVHAFFSKAWNRMASERVRRFGCGPARCGELVIPPEGWEPAGGWAAEEACDGAAEGWEGGADL
jgi:tRNA pseudouridine13 synthase